MTNAQAALQAAATFYGGRNSSYYRDNVMSAADDFKGWLDEQDRADKEKRAKAPKIPRPAVGFGGTRD